MTLNQITIGKLALALCGVLTAAFPAATAKADHCSYVYTGPTCGFAGESHMIAALQYMELGYLTHDRRSRHFRHAEDQIRKAKYAVCSRAARTYLRSADRHLDEFQWSGNTANLDQAARFVGLALQVERSNVQQVVVTPQVVPQRVGRPQYTNYAPYGPAQRGGANLYGRWGHLGIRF